MNPDKIYPRAHDRETVYLKNVVDDPLIQVGAYTIYNDFVNDPRDFQQNNVLYHYPINGDRLIIGKFCSIACGTRFLFTSANHTLRAFQHIRFPSFLKNGGWMLQTLPLLGTTKATSSSATMFGSVTRQSSSAA